MLIVKVFENDKEIDTLHIWNTGKMVGEMHEYRITAPLGFADHPILHRRKDGYSPLVRQALHLIEVVRKGEKGRKAK